MIFYPDQRPLEPCCVSMRHARVRRLWSSFEPTILAPMLYDLMADKAPSRLDEVRQTLFGVYQAEEPFWGIYDRFRCNECGRQLHALSIDGTLLVCIESMARHLFGVVDVAAEDDLRFLPSDADRQRAAREALRDILFRTGATEARGVHDIPRRPPQWYITEAMVLAFVFVLVHETSHQGPQASCAYDPMRYVPAAIRGAARLQLRLTQDQALAWAKELAADLNACLIMHTDQYRTVREECRTAWSRTFAAGIVFAIKAWDIVLREVTFGNTAVERRLLRTHPPASWRIAHISDQMENLSRLHPCGGDMVWAGRLLTALEGLYETGDPS